MDSSIKVDVHKIFYEVGRVNLLWRPLLLVSSAVHVLVSTNCSHLHVIRHRHFSPPH